MEHPVNWLHLTLYVLAMVIFLVAIAYVTGKGDD